jgi:flagellar hook-basal body complex protein FliE
MNFDAIRPISLPQLPAAAAKSSGSAAGSFADALQDAVSTVEKQRLDAQASVGRFLSGEGEELHQVALATQKAELSFEMFQQVRNKVVQAYQEVMRMQV